MSDLYWEVWLSEDGRAVIKSEVGDEHLRMEERIISGLDSEEEAIAFALGWNAADLRLGRRWFGPREPKDPSK